MATKSEKIPKNKSDIICWHDIRGCVDGSGSISKYRTQPQKWLKHQTTMSKNANNTPCYQNVEGAVARVQGPYPSIENVVTLWKVIISSG